MLEFCAQILISTTTRRDTQVFQLIFIVLVEFETLTGQRFKKEGSVHDVSMGCILKGIKQLNSIETDLL